MRTFLRTLIIMTAIIPTLSVFAGSSCGWFGFWDTSSCGDPKKIQYCQWSSCTLSGSITATENLADGLFTKKTLANFAQDIIKYFLGFVTLIGVIYVIYAGFQLMTGGWDEETVKKARKIIIYVIAGIVLMWLAYALVSIIITALTKTT